MESSIFKNKLTWVLGLFVIIVLFSILSALYFYKKAKESPAHTVEMVMNDFKSLEDAYSKAVKDLEAASTGSYDNIDILKENLKGILVEIKKRKQEVDESRKSNYDTLYTKSLKDKLAISKQVADELMAARLAELEQQNKELSANNQTLVKSNKDLETNLMRAKSAFEEKKAENSRLSAVLTSINQRISVLEKTGETKDAELKELKLKKDEFEKRLSENTKVLKQQNTQMNQLVAKLRKVNISCYFIYEQGNKGKEAKIYLTSAGVSTEYLSYFLKKKPTVYSEFSLDQELFSGGVEKVDFKLYNAAGVEIYSTSKTISETYLRIDTPSKNMGAGDYSVELNCGEEKLVIGGKYLFKI
jgi:hypothetical protein